MVRGFNHQRGTLAQGVYNGFSRQDAIFFGRNGFGKHNAVTALPVSANDRGDGSQVVFERSSSEMQNLHLCEKRSYSSGHLVMILFLILPELVRIAYPLQVK